jgi:peptidoglycan/xylan/chitin deacetylase (PgdA/CDA1 family)
MNNHSLSVTIDIEDWYHIPSVCGSPFSAYKDVAEFFDKWKGRYDYLSEPTKRVLDLLDEFEVTATFFVVADVEGIVDRGHEIACHGLHHSLKIHSKTKTPFMSVEEFKERTLKAKKILENSCGDKVIGYRAPAAYVGGWMLDVLADIGFKYDSSVCVNSLYNKTDSSLKGVSSYPYHPKKNSLVVGEERDFVEFPWAYWDVFGFNFKIPTSGGPMLRFLGAHVILRGLKQSLKRGHTVFYFHPIDISTEKFPEVGKGRPFLWVVKGKIVEKRIRYILKNLKDVGKLCLKDALDEIL